MFDHVPGHGGPVKMTYKINLTPREVIALSSLDSTIANIFNLTRHLSSASCISGVNVGHRHYTPTLSSLWSPLGMVSIPFLYVFFGTFILQCLE